MSKIKLNNVRISFPSLFKKAVFNGVETKFEATMLLDKDDQAEKITEIENAIKAMNKLHFKGAKLGADKICFKDGDDIDYDGYSGCMSIKAANHKRPMVIGRDKTPLVEDDDKPYAGCYVNAIIELWAQNNEYGKRINANLLAVQFYKDGEPFGAGGTTASADEFDAFDNDDFDDDDMPF